MSGTDGSLPAYVGTAAALGWEARGGMDDEEGENTGEEGHIQVKSNNAIRTFIRRRGLIG